MGTFVTETGLQKQSLLEIKKRIQARMQVLFGENVDLSEEGPLGIFVGEFSKGFSDMWDGLQEVYTSRDPAQATGTSLDIVSAITGIDRIEAAAASAYCFCYTTEAYSGMIIPAGKRVRRVRESLEFSLLEALTISSSTCRDIYLSLRNLSAGTTVVLTTSFGTFSAVHATTPQATMEALRNAIQASDWTGSASVYTGSAGGDGAQYTGDDPTLRLFHPTVNFSVQLTTYVGAYLIGSAGNFECVSIGLEYADAGEIREIVTPVANWLSVYNQVAAVPGREQETDSELRLRRAKNFTLGYATEEAIRYAILNEVEGVVSCIVTSNRTMVAEDGIPPKAFECVVMGGDPSDIAKTIWKTMPAGIKPWGNTEVKVKDSFGHDQSVWFSVAVPVYLHIRISYRLLNEEAFPVDGPDQIAAAIEAWATDEYSLGADVVPNRILTPIYSVPGIGDASVEVAVTTHSTDTPTYQSTTISIPGRSYAIPDASRITFIQVP